jgi:putative ABC transport system substrate-binding protein
MTLRRREFITLLGAAVVGPLAARAQSERMRRVGVLMGASATDQSFQSYLAAFVQGLRRSGWDEGQNLRMDVRWNPGDSGLAQTYAAQLIGLMPDVILAVTTVNLSAILQATNTVPVVFLLVADPVTQGFVPSLRQPGGIVTGFSFLEFSLGSKWIELLKKVAPALTRVSIMFNPDNLYSRFFMPTIDSAAASLGVEVTTSPIRTTSEIESVLSGLARTPDGGLVLTGDPFTNSHHSLIVNLALHHRLPSIGPGIDFAKNGGLMSYGPAISAEGQFRQAATYVDRILKGSKPGDLPVQLPDRYALVLNLKTAKTLGLTMPPTLLAIADEVIE